LANGGSNISRSLKLFCLKRNIENLSAIQEKSGYLLGQRGNERFVGNPEVIQERGSKLAGLVPGSLEVGICEVIAILTGNSETVRQQHVFKSGSKEQTNSPGILNNHLQQRVPSRSNAPAHESGPLLPWRPRTSTHWRSGYDGQNAKE
jgi:hypothetical protein